MPQPDNLNRAGGSQSSATFPAGPLTSISGGLAPEPGESFIGELSGFVSFKKLSVVQQGGRTLHRHDLGSFP